MAKKDLLIGGCTNYNINHLRPWVLSAVEHMPDAHKVMVVGEASDETKQWLVDQGFEIVPMARANIPVHVLRFISIYEYLRINWNLYNFVITTDVKDVYFQTNAFEEVARTCNYEKGYDLIIASEGLKYKDEPWGNENLHQAYGPYVYDLFKENEIFNVGTFGGKSEYVKDMVFNIFTNATNRPIPICDQAVFNVLINTKPYSDIVGYSHDWAAELGTVMDPSKIEQFRPNLMFSEPIWKDGQLWIPPMGQRPFPIVHQYDRVPEIKKFIDEKYGVEDLITFRTH